MENITNNISDYISVCPYNNCISIPRINLLKDSQQIKIICNEHGVSYNKNFEISKYLSENKDLKNKLICSTCHIALKENDNFFYCNTCKKLFCKKCNYNNLFHEHIIINRNYSNFWNKCRIHNIIYSKYCKTCSISLCGNCDERPHKNHIIINTNEKNECEKAKLKNILETQEKTFQIVEKITNDCLAAIKNQLKLKKLILKNYLNYGNNGNSIENLNEFFYPINPHYREKIENLNNENASFNDKLLCLNYFHQMCNHEGRPIGGVKKGSLSGMLSKYINEELYKKVINHEKINEDLVDIINVEKDGNCFYRVISYFLYNNEESHLEIRKQIYERSKEFHNKNKDKIGLIENIDDLSMTQYINNKIQNEGEYAGDFEISIAHQLFNINIATYRPGEDNKLSFIKFYNDDKNYKRHLLILIYINNNHYQLAYYKSNNRNIEQFEMNKNENKNIGKNSLKQEIYKKVYKEESNITPNKSAKKKNTYKKFESFENEKNVKISSIREDAKIKSMIRLSSGNLAVGFSNGIIKIYDVNYICSNNYKDKEMENKELLIINDFRGKRINYLYELSDKTILCASISKIHHIQLTDEDTRYKYIGSINIYKKEVPKRIIELGNELIVSLGEKQYKRENITKTKCLLKIFNKIQDSKKESEDNSFCLLSDNSDFESVCSSLSSKSQWSEVYSSPDDDSFDNGMEKNYQNDDKIKLYRNNQNKDNIYICSIFPIENKHKKGEGIVYEFIATSNKEFYNGENCIQIFGIIKNPIRHGFTFFIHKTLNDLSCSRMVDSISKLNNDLIGIGLQKYKENYCNGIALLDLDKLEIVRIIEGLSIGLLNTSINNSKFIFFSSNQTKDVKKCNEIRLYEINDIKTDNLSKQKDNIIFKINSGFLCLVELIPSSHSSKNIYYACSYNNKIFYIIEIGSNLK